MVNSEDLRIGRTADPSRENVSCGVVVAIGLSLVVRIVPGSL